MDKSHITCLHDIHSQVVSFAEEYKEIWDYLSGVHLKEELHLYQTPG